VGFNRDSPGSNDLDLKIKEAIKSRLNAACQSPGFQEFYRQKWDASSPMIIGSLQKMGIDVPPDKILILQHTLVKEEGAFNAFNPKFRKGFLHSINCHMPIFSPHHQFADQGIIKR
jgi:hypothetical protein